MSESNALPKGWAEASIDDISDVVRGISFPTNAKHPTPQKGDIACLRTANVQAEVEWDDLWYVPETYVGRDEQFVHEDDILISTANSYELVGKVARVRRVPMRSSLGAFIALMRCRDVVTPAFLHHQMCSLEVSARLRAMASTTTNISNISTGKLRELVLRIPPLREQHRIVEKIEELFSDLDAGVSALQRAKANLKRYRASVLKSAVEGRLTEEWRKEDPQAEDGQMLLDRILRERREKWEKDQLAKFREKGKEPPKNWQSKYEEPSAPDTSELPKLPEGWAWASLDMLLSEPLRNGHSARTSADGKGVRTISITAVTYDAFTEENIKYTIADPDFVADLWLEPGDILIQRSNTPELVGTARLFNGESRFAIFPDLLIRIRTTPAVSVRFVGLLLQASATRQYFRSHAKGLAGSMPKIDQGTVLKCPVPLPPLAEQEQIVLLVEERLSQIDSAERTIHAELIRAKRLRQSILKQAFEGKLVPQDPKDEPASVLLERIKVTREAEQPKKKAKKATKAKAL
jgi:type I restriction enzyme S subunit